MKIDYASSAMEAQDFTALFKNSSKMPGQQAQKFNRLMIQGLAKNGATVRAVTARPVTVKNCFKKYLRSKHIQHGDVKYHYCSVLNVMGIKVLWQLATSFFTVLFGGCDAVVTDVLNASVAYGAVTAARIRKKPCIGIVTDLPELMVTGTNQNHVQLVHKTIHKCTGYVFLTEAMNEKINSFGKPYCIIEGLCDITLSTYNKYENNSYVKKCMYAGFLAEEYGVKAMVDSFISANIKDTELHIYGSGPYAENLIEVCKNQTNVFYHGTVMNQEIVHAELEADLLVNPRPTNVEFAKYSFPSKNLEYMVSGTAVLTTNLPGMPEEYKPYVYLFEDESIQGMVKCFSAVLHKSRSELLNKGKAAKKFVLENKNNVIQSRKILDMIKEFD